MHWKWSAWGSESCSKSQHCVILWQLLSLCDQSPFLSQLLTRTAEVHTQLASAAQSPLTLLCYLQTCGEVLLTRVYSSVTCFSAEEEDKYFIVAKVLHCQISFFPSDRPIQTFIAVTWTENKLNSAFVCGGKQEVHSRTMSPVNLETLIRGQAGWEKDWTIKIHVPFFAKFKSLQHQTV